MKCCKPTLREELLGWLVNPNIALLFLVGGALLIYLEFNTPGTIVPGALGTLMVLLAIFALNLLPIRYTAVLLLVAALVLLLLEAKFGGHGALAIAGIVCLTFGTLTLVAAPVPEMGVSPWVAIAVSAGFGGDHRLSGAAGGARPAHEGSRWASMRWWAAAATAMEPLTPEGHVLVEGEIWRAVASEPVAAGSAAARGGPRAVSAARGAGRAADHDRRQIRRISCTGVQSVLSEGSPMSDVMHSDSDSRRHRRPLPAQLHQDSARV